MSFIPVYQPDLSGNEKKYVLECLDSTWISSKGRFIQAFEDDFAAYIGASHAIGVCNGTVALHLALVALGIGPGDEVIVPSFTYIASVNAIRYTGAKPVFADSLPDSWQIDPGHARQLISPATRAIMVVHLYGGASDMSALSALCVEHGLRLVEDCAEAIGTRVDGQHVGTFGDVATFSFFGNKTITTGEGGMVTCLDGDLGERIRHLRGQGLAKNREYWHDVVGYNYRMTNICAAIGCAQLERVEHILEGKRELARHYRDTLAAAPVSFQGASPGETASHWMVTLMTDDAAQRDPLRRHLAEAGIETRPAFHPVHTMPMYVEDGLRLPVAENLASRGINLPSWQALPQAERDRISDTILAHPWKDA